MTLSRLDRAVLHEIAVELLTMITPDLDEVRNLADRIRDIEANGDRQLDSLLFDAHWAVGDVGEQGEGALLSDIDHAVKTISAVLNYRAPLAAAA